MSLDELGIVLEKLSQKLLGKSKCVAISKKNYHSSCAAPIREQRIFKEELIVGAPNLIITSPGIAKCTKEKYTATCM